jgi:hypothetical protein
MINQIERADPRIGVNALAQYLVAPAGKRRRIISEQKRPKTFQVVYYDPAIDPICEFLAGNIDHEELLLRRKAVIDAPVAKDWGAQRNESCGKAIRAIATAAPRLLLEELEVKRAMDQPPKLLIGAVQVSVRPELYLIRAGSDDEPAQRGYLKLYFSKNEPLSSEVGEYIAAILHQYAEMRLAKKGGCDRRLCRVLDVFTGKFHLAPKAIKRRREDIAEACREIETMWPTA